jgi:hypothetical protein
MKITELINTKDCRLPGAVDLLFLPAHHPGDEGIGAQLLALCLWVRGFGSDHGLGVVTYVS